MAHDEPMPHPESIARPPSRLPSIWQVMQHKGYSRRDLLQVCSYTGSLAGLGTGGVASVMSAFESKPRLPVIWLQSRKCGQCRESFGRSNHPIIGDVVLDQIRLDCTTGFQEPASFLRDGIRDVMSEYGHRYVLVIEGSLRLDPHGARSPDDHNRNAREILNVYANGATAVLAWGSCAPEGFIQGLIDRPVIHVPGCPPTAEVMTGIMAHILIHDRVPELDSLGRPRTFFARRIHDTCSRRPYYDASLFVESWADETSRKGFCLFKLGCRGPLTYHSGTAPCRHDRPVLPVESGTNAD